MKKVSLFQSNNILYLVAGLILGSIGMVFAQTTLMEVDGDVNIADDSLVVDSTNKRVGINVTSPSTRLSIGIDHYSNGMQGIRFDSSSINEDSVVQGVESVSDSAIVLGANSYANTSGILDRFDDSSESAALLIQSDGSLGFFTGGDQSDPVEVMTVTKDGDVGIGTDTPVERIEIDAVLAIQGNTCTAPNTDSGVAKLYACESGGVTEMYAQDSSGGAQQISSHKDPKLVDPTVQSSFDDPTVELPFSVSHSNVFVGKGAVVDMSGLVAECERRFGISFTTVYDLPPESVQDEQEWKEKARERWIEKEKKRLLSASPETEIAIDDALEEVPEMERKEVLRPVTRYRYDPDSLVVSSVRVNDMFAELVPTGRTIRVLKDGVRFDEENGKFYKQRTLEEVTLTEAVPDPELPEWVSSRLPNQ